MKTRDFRKSKSYSKLICYNCGIAGHKSAECQKHPKKWCNHCKSSSHTDNVCRKQQKHSSKYAANSTANDDGDSKHSYSFHVSDSDNMFLSPEGNEKFLVDCRATTHIVNKDTYFVEINKSFEPEEHYIELANGSKSNNLARKKGTVLISLQTIEGKLAKVKLKNVFLCLPFHNASFPYSQPPGKEPKSTSMVIAVC